MAKRRLIIRHHGIDVSDEIELISTPWSQPRLIHSLRADGATPVEIGWLECREPTFTEPGYSAEIVVA